MRAKGYEELHQGILETKILLQNNKFKKVTENSSGAWMLPLTMPRQDQVVLERLRVRHT